MSDDNHDENEKPKGMDFAKLGLEISDEKREAVGKKLRKQLSLAMNLPNIGQVGATQNAMRGIGTSGVFADIANQTERLSQIVNPVGLRHTNLGIDTTPIGSMHSLVESIQTKNPLARLAEDLERQSRMFDSLSIGVHRHLDLLPSVMRSFETNYAQGLTRALDLPRIGDSFAAMNIGKYGSILDNVSALRGLGLGPGFGSQFSAVATGLTEQMQTLGQIGKITAAAQINLGLSGNIEEMLARTIAAQEALAEQEQAPVDETNRAKLARQLQLLCNIFTILSFFMMVALEIEDRLSDDRDAAIRADTETMEQMQVSLDALTSQLREMRAAQEVATAQNEKADVVIADLLREIADSVADQANSNVPDGLKVKKSKSD